jgi:hypothetical protein
MMSHGVTSDIMLYPEEDYRPDAGAIFETVPFDMNDERKAVLRHHPTPHQFFAEGLLP